MSLRLLPILSALGLAACSSVKNKALVAQVDHFKVGSVTAAGADTREIERNFKSAQLKRNILHSTLLLAGGVAAGSIGGQAGTNSYITQTTASGDPLQATPRQGIALLTAEEASIQNRILTLAGTHQAAALNQALRGYAPTAPRFSPTGGWKLDCRLTYTGHDRRKKHHYVWLEGIATLTSPQNEVVWKGNVYGESDTPFGGPAAPVFTTPESFLAPAALASHVRAATTWLANDVAEKLADAMKWND